MKKAAEIIGQSIAVLMSIVIGGLLIATILGIMLIVAGLIWAGVLLVWGWII